MESPQAAVRTALRRWARSLSGPDLRRCLSTDKFWTLAPDEQRVLLEEAKSRLFVFEQAQEAHP